MTRRTRVYVFSFALLLGACSDPAAVETPRPAELVMLAGNTQSGVIGSELPNPIVIQVLDQRGKPVPGVAVNWEVEPWAGTIEPLAETTNESGAAHARWILGDVAGEASARATVGTLGSVEFTAIAENPLPALLTISPEAAVAGDGDLIIVVTGTGFVGGASVAWNGTPLPTSYVSERELSAQVPANALEGSGSPQISVLNPAPGGGASGTLPFEILSPLSLQVASRVIDASGDRTCALSESGDVYCWTSYDPSGPAPERVTSDPKFASIGLGNGYTCGVTADAKGFCWGGGGHGQLGNGDRTSRESPTAIAGDISFVDIDGGSGLTCGLAVTGETYCWGENTWNLLDRAFASDVPVRLDVPPLLSKLSSFRYSHTCGLNVDGRTYCWGLNSHGQYGIPADTGTVTTPRLAGDNSRFVQIAGGYFHTCGVTTSGAAHCWGSPEFGMNGSATYETPTVIDSLQFTQIATGKYHTCAVAVDGAAYCWGLAESGQLGNGQNHTVSRVPARVAGNLDFTALAAGNGHTCGITTDGSAYCWGDVVIGPDQCHRGITCSTTPVRVPGNIRFRTE